MRRKSPNFSRSQWLNTIDKGKSGRFTREAPECEGEKPETEVNIKLAASTVIVATVVCVAVYYVWRGRKVKANQGDVKGVHQAVKQALQSHGLQEKGATSHERPWEAWDSLEGMARLQNSGAKANFWQLVRFYEAQIRLTYCSIATSVMALNALGIAAPLSKFLGRYQMLDLLHNFLRARVRARAPARIDLRTILINIATIRTRNSRPFAFL